MAKNFNQMAKDIVRELGEEQNIISLNHCMTRLRFKVKDKDNVDVESLKQINGVIQVLVAGGQYQVVIGTDVSDVYEEIGKITSINLGGDDEEADHKSFLGKAIDIISGIFMPFMGAFMAAGLLKGLLVLLVTTNILSNEGTTYKILFAAADGVFYFLPFFLAHTAGKKFKTNPYISMAIAAGLVYPAITALTSGGAEVTFIGIPVVLIRYTSSVIPVIIAVYVQSRFEKLLKLVLPKVIQGILVPFITLLVILPVTFLVIGPVTDILASNLAKGIDLILGFSPPVAGALLGFFWPIMIIFGLHWGLIPIVMNNYAAYGYDNLMPIVVATGFAITGACLAVFFKTKDRELKQIAGSSVISAFLGGVTEPAIYGVVLKYKRPFVIACVANAISGILLATAGSLATAFLSGNLLTLPAVVAMYGSVGAIGMFSALILSFTATYIFGYNDKMLVKSSN